MGCQRHPKLISPHYHLYLHLLGAVHVSNALPASLIFILFCLLLWLKASHFNCSLHHTGDLLIQRHIHFCVLATLHDFVDILLSVVNW